MLKKLLFALLLMVIGVSAQATVYTFSPDPVDMWDLDHYNAYSWGIDWQPDAGDEIIGASLTFTNIYDWVVEDNDSLYIHLLDETTSGALRLDDYGQFDDYFAGQGLHIGTYTDIYGGGPGVNVTYDFTADQLAALNSYSANGNFGFGFDPDCHYYNDGIEFTVQTAVPEPATMILFGLGLAGVGLKRRFKK